ncbi:MAG: polysaccharide biosynthesis protein [Bacteroidales bacterium]|nr:polysaccharide biosynthesis protein [Bacteroidales bacterium]
MKQEGNPIKELAGQTVLYGLGTIVPRFLNYAILTPFYTRVLGLTSYGIVTELYAWMAVLLVVLTYGMETAYFRYASHAEKKDNIYSSSVITMAFTSAFFMIGIIIFLRPVAEIMDYANHPEYILFFSLIVAVDAFSAVPFARLRLENKGLKFGFIKLINVGIIIVLVFLYLYFIPEILKNNPESFVKYIYNEKIGVGYVFIANLAGSIVSLILVMIENKGIRLYYNKEVVRKMLLYGLPLMIAGLFGILNDSLDKIILKRFYTGDEGLRLLGIYGANYKVAVLMTLFIQMFRYAVEPFFFRHARTKNAKPLYATVMRYYILFGFIIYLGIIINLDIVKYLIGPDYWGGLKIVPVVLAANLLFGVFINLSVWYKINDLTRFAIVLNGAGLVMTIAINLLFIPSFGYVASAWGHVGAYVVMVSLSWYIGSKKYYISYQIKKIFIHTLIFVVFIATVLYFSPEGSVLRILLYDTILAGLILILMKRERKNIKNRTWEEKN